MKAEWRFKIKPKCGKKSPRHPAAGTINSEYEFHRAAVAERKK